MSDAKTILIVEDERPMRKALIQKLTREGFSCLEAGDGQSCLDIAFRERPDLILLDVKMPKMDGMTALQKIREDSWGKSVPIIMLTNIETSEEILSGVERDHPAYYLVKSDWEIHDVVEKIRAVLEV
jgi:two-component system, OmpR family, response regulator MprA